MNKANGTTAPLWVTIVSGLFLVWNLFGLMVFVLAMTQFSKREALEDAGLNEQQIDLILSTPTWVNIAFGGAVIFGVLGCVALLLKMKWAIPLLVLSLLAVIAQNTYMYFLSDTIKHMGVGASPFVIAGAIALIPYAIFCASKGWLK